jgi:hypothetical protein
MSNLSRFAVKDASNEGRWMELSDPEDRGKPLLNGEKPIRFLLRGQDSDAFVRQRNINRGIEMGEVRKNINFSQSVADERSQKLLAACVKDWEGVPQGWIDGSDNDEPISYSNENCIKLFQNMQWVMDEIDQFVGDRKNYFAASPKI